MTKVELIKMLETIEDNEEIIFVEEARDWDNFPYDRANKNIYRVVKAGTEFEYVKEYGVTVRRFKR